MKSSTTYNCRNCGTEATVSKQKLNVYCSNNCQREFEYKERIRIWKETGEISTTTLRKHLLKEKGVCSACGINEWNNKTIVLELEHKDGNALNNSEDNVCLLCPNCHSQTDTYKAKNKGNGRSKRRERYIKRPV